MYLLQLWNDTFMMEQDKYPGFGMHYRKLCGLGVKFPPRDPNVRLMMQGLAEVESPMFDFVEQQHGKERPPDVQPTPEPKVDDYMAEEVAVDL